MSDYLATVAYYTRIVDRGDYYIVEYFDDKFIVKKNNVEHDIMKIARRIPCPYIYAFLRVLSLRMRFDEDAVMRSIRC
jgi:methyl coenzyme M reductase alpha subunit